MTTKSKNTIPEGLSDLISSGTTALAGVKAYGAALPLQHSTEAVLSAALYVLAGSPVDAATPGKDRQLSGALAGKAAARAALKAAITAGRDLCFEVVNSLRSSYGQRWNSRWADAGFTWGGLSVPVDLVPMLNSLRDHLRDHPELDDAPGVMAAACSARLDAIGAAEAALNGGKSAVRAARRERNAAKERLRQRLIALRKELEVLLPVDDERWYKFGFQRPADGRIPARVEGVTLAPGLPGEVSVAWDAARLALNYRVTRQVVGTDAEPVEVGLFTDRTTVVRGLPSGATVKVRVSARNASGESASAEASLTVP